MVETVRSRDVLRSKAMWQARLSTASPVLALH